jgi:3-dehydroquinate dehydratase type I
MICVSLAEKNLADCLAALKGLPFAEIRMDMMDLTPSEVRTIFSGHPNLIATCRPGKHPADVCRTLLLEAIGAGAAYVDVEVHWPASFREEVVAAAKAAGCAVIASYHDFEKTPGREALERLVSECFATGAEIAKIACMAQSEADNARLLGLLDGDKKMVVIGMGEIGKVTRVAAPLSGALFTFASLTKGKETADGQIDKETLEAIFRRLAPRKAGGT